MPLTHLTRFKPPCTISILHRDRLFEILDHLRRHRAVWLCALAGAGKTTLLSSYLENRNLPGIWYQIDPADHDPGVFFHDLATNVPYFHSEKTPLPTFSPEQLQSLPIFTRRFFQALGERLPLNSLLILDDYHEVAEDSPLHEIIRYGLPLLPPGNCAVFLSRRPQPPLLTRMLVTGEMVRFPGEQLKLTMEESLQIARLKATSQVPETETIEMLHTQAEGWAAGLVLSLIPVDGLEQPERLSKENLFRYFSGEILKKLNSEEREFVEKTALMTEFTVAMAEKLTGRKNAHHLLGRLVKNNFFLTYKGDDPPVYRFHTLFREYLLERCIADHSREEMAELRQKTAEIFRDEGFFEAAFELLATAGLWDSAADLIRSQAPGMIEQGRLRTLEGWLTRLPEELFDGDPWLLLWRGTARLPMRGPLEALKSFEKAFSGFDAAHDANGKILAWCGVVESLIFDWRDPRPLDEWFEKLEPRCGVLPKVSNPDICARVVLNMLGSLSLRRPWAEEIGPLMLLAKKLLRKSQAAPLRLGLYRQLIHLHVCRGEFPLASTLLEEAEADEESLCRTPMESLLFLATAAEARWRMGHFGQAISLARKGLADAEEIDFPAVCARLLASGAYAAMGEGNFSLAREFLDRMKRLISPDRLLDFAHYHFIKAQEQLLLRRYRSAGRHLDTADAAACEIGAPFPMAVNRIARALLLVEGESFREAEDHLEAAEKIAERMDSDLLRSKCAFARAEISMAEGGIPEKHLSWAFALARKRNLINFAWWRPRAMADLCAQALESNIEREFVRDLVRLRGLVPEKPPIEVTDWPWPVRIYTLGRFSVLKDGEPLRFERKGQKRPLQLLQALVALGGREVSQMQLEDALWPDAPVGTAAKSFNTTLYRLRKLVGPDALRLEDGRVSLDARFCRVDVWAYERLLRKLLGALREDDLEGALRLSEKALALFQGPFLDREAQEEWMHPLRQKLRRRTAAVFFDLARLLGRHDMCEKSIELFGRLIDADPRAEEYHHRLMTCQAATGRFDEAMATYRNCRGLLKLSIRNSLPSQIEALYQNLRQGDPSLRASICTACR